MLGTETEALVRQHSSPPLIILTKRDPQAPFHVKQKPVRIGGATAIALQFELQPFPFKRELHCSKGDPLPNANKDTCTEVAAKSFHVKQRGRITEHGPRKRRDKFEGLVLNKSFT